MHEEFRESINSAPLPTSQTLGRRVSLPFQVFRFAAINLRMIRVIFRGHA